MEADNPIVSDFRAQVQKIIQANLKDNLSSMSDEELASFLIDLYMMRTKNHIALVNTVASHMFPAFEKVGLGREDYEVFLHEAEHHDSDKLKNDPETIAIQVLGSINKYSKASGLYRPSQYVMFKYLDVMSNHVKKNQHHPEFWASVIKNDNKLILNMDATSLFGKAEPYLTSLSTGFRILAEMVCDWTAVGIELKSTSAKEWFEQWYGKRWVADAMIMKLMNTLCEVTEEATKDKEFVMPYDYSNLKWPTKIPDEINDRSCEDMFILTKTLKHQKLNALAKPLYNPVGQNSWEHIQQDVANGVYLVQQVQNREITLQEYATILFHDCSVKSHPDKVKHSLVSADIAKPILVKTGFFTPEEIDEIYQAIVEHDYEMNPEMKFSTDLSDFLASADFNPPNYAWILNKSYSWGISHGLDHEGRIQNVFTHIPKTYGSKGTITYPKLYTACYQDKIKEMQKFFDNMTKESCEETIMEYRKRCGLSDTDTQLPDPSKEAIEEMFLFTSIGVEECSAEADKVAKDITFPPSEIDTLKKQDTIVTTRVSADFGAFRRHDLVKTPWGAIFEVSQRFVIDDISKHPYYNELTKRQIAYLQKFDKIAVLTLTKVKDSSTEAFSFDAQNVHMRELTEEPTEEEYEIILKSSNEAAKASSDPLWTMDELKKARKSKGSKYRHLCIFYADSQPIGSAMYMDPDPKVRCFSIGDFGLHKEYQGKGLGSKCFRLIMNKLKSKDPSLPIYLGVAANNERAIKLYEKFGFKIVKTGMEGKKKFYQMCYGTPLKVSEESLSDKISSNIRDDKVYHCSPFKLDVLRGSTSRTEGAKGSIFVSPFKHFASMFILNFQDIVDEIEKQIGKKHIQINNFGFKEWNQTPASTTSIPSVINVLVRTPEEFKPFEGKAKGYMYTIDFKQYRDKADMWTKAKDSDCEFIIHDNIVPEKCDEITINYTVRREEKEDRRPESSSEALDDTVKVYYLSPVDKDHIDLTPRVPDNEFITWGVEDGKTKRVCLCTSIDKCILAAGRFKPGQTLTVYSAQVSKSDLVQPSKDQVPDVNITGELWFFKDISLQKEKVIHLTGYVKKGYTLTFKRNDGSVYEGHPKVYEYETVSTEVIHSVMVENFIDNNANFYRVVYEGVEIYQAMKEHSSKQQWEEFLSTDAARWLPKPDCDYRPTYESYFTSLGYKTFMEKTESYLKKVLDPNKIRVQNYGNIDLSACVYQDPFQIVIDTRKLKDKPMIVDLFVDFE